LGGLAPIFAPGSRPPGQLRMPGGGSLLGVVVQALCAEPRSGHSTLGLRGSDNALGLAARVLRYEGPALGRQVIGASWLVRDVYQEPRDHAGRTGPSRLVREMVLVTKTSGSPASRNRRSAATAPQTASTTRSGRAAEVKKQV
jgi:hypothetical protein